MTFEIRFGVSYFLIKLVQFLDMIELDLYTTLGSSLGLALSYTMIKRYWDTHHVAETTVEIEDNPEVIKTQDFNETAVREIIISEHVYRINKE